MTIQPPQTSWTKKAPTLVLGLASALGGRVASRRGVRSVGLVLLLLGAAFVAYSFTIKDWCYQHKHGLGGGAWGETSFGQKLGECIREKGWLSF